MNIIIANDGGRLSAHPRLKTRCLPQSVLLADLDGQKTKTRSRGDTVFIDSIRSLRGPCVLMWHEDTLSALKMLSRILQDGRWPENLHGIVLFRAAHYAGLFNAERVSEELRRYALPDEKVHIFWDVVSLNASDSVLAQIERFCDAVAAQERGAPPFKLLEPPSINNGLLTLLVLDRVLLSQGERQTNDIFQNVRWTRVRADLKTIGISLSEVPSIDQIQAIAKRIRECTNVGRVDFEALVTRPLRCCGCGIRSAIYHTDILRAAACKTADAKVVILRDICARVFALLKEPHYYADKLAEEISQRMTMFSINQSRAQICSSVDAVLSEQCCLVAKREIIRSVIVWGEETLAFNASIADVERRLEAVLECRGQLEL
jgi:hypothetical protein